jgi:hypothetical protein
VRAYFLRVFSERDSTDTCASGRPGLNLDDRFAAEFFRGGHSVISGRSGAPTRNLKSVSGEDRFASIFVKPRHSCVLLFPRSKQYFQCDLRTRIFCL